MNKQILYLVLSAVLLVLVLFFILSVTRVNHRRNKGIQDPPMFI